MMNVLLLLAAVTLSETQVGMGVLAFFSALVGYHFIARKYIREQSGMKETLTMEISGQPVRTEHAIRMATHEELSQVRAEVGILRTEMKADINDLHRQIGSGFDKLNQERRTSIAGLHHKLDEQERRHSERTTLIMERIGQLTGRPGK